MEKVTVSELDHLLQDLVEWEGFALQLPTIIDVNIEVIRKNHPNNNALQKIALYTKWLQKCVHPSWEDVIKALQSINQNALAQSVRDSIAPSKIVVVICINFT